jgi:hypothetical protein
MLSVETLVSHDEALFVRHKLGQASSGEEALIQCIYSLDKAGRQKMALGFPGIVEVVNKYNFERGYAKDLISRYNEEFGTKINF